MNVKNKINGENKIKIKTINHLILYINDLLNNAINGEIKDNVIKFENGEIVNFKITKFIG